MTTTNSFPLSLDVQVSVSKAQATSRRDLSVVCFATSGLGFLPTQRVRFYLDSDAAAADFSTVAPFNTEAAAAATAFFAQPAHPVKMAVGELYLTGVAAQLIAGPFTAAELAAIKAITNGSLTISYDNGDGAGSVTKSITGLNFSAVNTITDVATVINTALAGATIGCLVLTVPGGAEYLAIATNNTTSETSMLYPVANATGTDMKTLLKLTAAAGGQLQQNGEDGDVVPGITSIQNAVKNLGSYAYGWAFGTAMRNDADQEAIAAWALGQKVIAALVNNSVTAYDPGYTTDAGSVISATKNRRAVAIFHDNPAYFPDVSILAFMLGVNYQLQDSTVNAKFAALPGIPPVNITETQWLALKAKGYNTYTLMDGGAQVYREGSTEDTSYFMDSTINLDNFTEDLQVNVYNVFLANKKVPYTRPGQLMLIDACNDTGNQYVYNGTFAPRQIVDSTSKSGYSTLPAVQINPTPIANMSASDRSNRIGPPIQMICQEAGAMNSVAISVSVVD